MSAGRVVVIVLLAAGAFGALMLVRRGSSRAPARAAESAPRVSPALLLPSPADTVRPTRYRLVTLDYFRYAPGAAKPETGEWVARGTLEAPDGARCSAYLTYGPFDPKTGINHGLYLKRADLARHSCAAAAAAFSRSTRQVLGVEPGRLREVETF